MNDVCTCSPAIHRCLPTAPNGSECEDEACRRIDVARLARRFPALFELLASGRISLSVAALLKHHLTEPDHVALLKAVSGKTVKQARDVMVAWFPRPDVPATIRKLPERNPLNT